MECSLSALQDDYKSSDRPLRLMRFPGAVPFGGVGFVSTDFSYGVEKEHSVGGISLLMPHDGLRLPCLLWITECGHVFAALTC